MPGHHYGTRTAARYGTPISTRVVPDVAAALLDEAKRCQRTVDHVVSELLRYWYEDVYLPTKKEREKKGRPPAP